MAARIKWFATETGRKFSLGVGVFCGISAFSAQWLPHTLLKDKYQNILHLYKFGKSVPVPDELIARAKEVQEDMKMKPKQKDCISYFTIYGFDIGHIGSTNFNSGVALGFPVNFTYKSPDDMDRQSIVVQNHHIDWLKPEAQSLQSALLLTDSAQKFAIARELSLSTTNQVMNKSIINFGAVAVYYMLSHNFNKRLRGFERGPGFRMGVYTIVGLFCGTLWALARDLATVYYEEWSDKQASLLGEQYALGAVEYYNKALQRNVALRHLLGETEGPKHYTAFGNDHTLFRTPHMPFTARRDLAVLRYGALAAEKGKTPVAEVVTV